MEAQISLKLSDVQNQILKMIAAERNVDVGVLCANEASMSLIRNRVMQQSNELINQDKYPDEVIAVLLPAATTSATATGAAA